MASYTGRVISPPRAPSPWLIWLAAAAFWIFAGLMYVAQMYWLAHTPGVRMTPITRATWVWQGSFYLAWIPITVLVWRVTARWQLDTLGWPRLLLRHAIALPLVGILQSAVVVAIGFLFVTESETMRAALIGQLRGRLYQTGIIYPAIVVAGQAMQLYERWRARELQAAQLETQLTAARLEALRAQLHPHFLFNSLHTVASLVRDGRNAEAVQLISGMSDLLRRLLDTRDHAHPIEDELAAARTYLEVQRARFGERLTADVTLAADATHARVPVLIVQPLVENALRHGLADRVEAGHVDVAVSRDRDDLVICVRDTGVGVAPGWRADDSAGTGLANVRGRLQAMYPGRGTIAAGPRAGGGFDVTIRLPFTVA